MKRTAPSTVLAVASLGVFMAFVDATIVNIAFPALADSFPETDIAGLSWVLNAYNIVFAAFLVAAGRIADLLGRRRVLLAGLVLFSVASALCAVAPSVGLLVAARVLQALGAALLVPSSLGVVLEAFGPERRAYAVALLTAVGAVAAGVGPSLGGALVSLSGWRLVFLVNVPVGVAAYVLSRRYLDESRAPGRRRIPDLTGALAFALAIASLVLAVVKGSDWGWASPRVLGCFALAVALGAVVGRRCTWHRSPVIDLGLLRVRTFAVANAMSVLAAAGFYGYTLANVLFLTGVWGYSVLAAGLAITPGPFVAAAVAGPSSRVAERYGHRVVLLAGGVVWAGAVTWLAVRVGDTPAFVREWLPATVLLGLGAGITLPNLSGVAIASAPGEAFATATGLNSVARQVGAALGVAVVVALIGAPQTIAAAAAALDHAWAFAAACLLAVGLGCLGIGRLAVAAGAAAPPTLAGAARAVLPRAPREVQTLRPPAPVARMAPGTEEAARRPESVEEFLAGVPLLADVGPPVRADLAAAARRVRVGAGEWLFRQGDEGDAMYVVRAGRLEVSKEHGAGTDVVEVGRGAAIGELSLLTSSPRSASVRAARDSDLIAIDHEDFQRLLRASPELSRAMIRVLGEHLRASRPAAPAVRPLPATIALLALDDAVPLADLAARLAPALGTGPITVLDGAELASPATGTTPAASYGPLVDRAERASDRVVLVAGRAVPAAWFEFCVQQGDRLLAVAHEPGPGGQAVPPGLRGCDLVGYDVARGATVLAGWAEALEPLEAHSLSPGPELDRDVARLARRLTGRSVGIVLSGGGARAFSHLGVLEELAVAGITIDRVGGVSMGAFIGAMHAAGMDTEDMAARCYEEWVRRRPLGDYTLPRHALIRGHRVEAMLDRVFGTLAIEELTLGYFCASADLRSGELVVSRSGPLHEHVGVSMCMPLLAPPQVRGGKLLVDGSLVDNLPISTMAALGEGPMIAVDVKASLAGDGRPSGRARDARAPGLGETMTRVLLLASSNTSAAARRHADLIIKPRNDGIGLLEFHQLDRAREAGRHAVHEALEQAPAALLGLGGAVPLAPSVD